MSAIELWDYADEHFSNAELIRERYQGIRPAPGYPACPDHSLKPILFDMLGGAPGEVELTENFAMLPTSAVSGFYFAHRDSQLFRRGADRPGPARGICRAARGRCRRGDKVAAAQSRLAGEDFESGLGPIPAFRPQVKRRSIMSCLSTSAFALIAAAGIQPAAASDHLDTRTVSSGSACGHRRPLRVDLQRWEAAQSRDDRCRA